jgi:hypothetical protein
MTAFKVIFKDIYFVSAGANAMPSRFPGLVKTVKRGQLAEGLIGQVRHFARLLYAILL